MIRPDQTSHVRVVPLITLRRFDLMLKGIVVLQVVNIVLSVWRLRG